MSDRRQRLVDTNRIRALGQIEGKSRALPRLALYINGATEFGHDTMHDSKPETSTGTLPARREKGFKQAFHDLGIDTRTLIGDRQTQVVTCNEPAMRQHARDLDV